MNLSQRIEILRLKQKLVMIFADAVGDKHKWITTETGSHIKIDGEGNIVAGAGGKFNGKPLSAMGGTKKFTKYETNAERAESAVLSNNLTNGENTSTLSSTSQSEAKTGDKKMNTEKLVNQHGKEWTSPAGVKRVYFNGQDGIDFLTQLSESSQMPMPVPNAMGKKQLFQLHDGSFATDDGQIANVLRGAGLKTIRSDKDFKKIKEIESGNSAKTNAEKRNLYVSNKKIDDQVKSDVSEYWNE